MITPLVSVVMSVFNGERFLREAVESILDQGFRELEFIIIDDGSTDASASILDSYRKQDARAKVYHRPHSGLIESLNIGSALAKGKYIARMDADDVSCKERLEWQLSYMEAEPDIGVLGGAVEFIDSRGRSFGAHRNPVEDHLIKAALLDRCAFWHPTIVLRRELLARAGGYRHVVVDAEDYDLWLRLAEHVQLANLDEVVLKYRVHSQQVSVRKRARQTLSILAAQLAATARKNGLRDPLNDLREITPAVLSTLGLPQAELRNVIVSDYWHWVRNLRLAGEYSAALEAAQEVLRSNLAGVARWQVADLHITVAQLLWRERRFLSAQIWMLRAVLVWPLVAARPFKFLQRRLLPALSIKGNLQQHLTTRRERESAGDSHDGN